MGLREVIIKKDFLPRCDYLETSVGKESACNAGDTGLIPGSGRSAGERISYLLQNACLENPCGQRSLVGYTPWGHKESDTT